MAVKGSGVQKHVCWCQQVKGLKQRSHATWTDEFRFKAKNLTQNPKVHRVAYYNFHAEMKTHCHYDMG